MKILNLKEIQKIEYEILENFVKFCEKYNLNYCLCGGTLLGAIRHKGFIPWDDDIDIIMPRPDFEKFINLIKNQEIKKELKNLEIASYYLDKNYIYPITKIYDTRTQIILNDHIKNYPLGIWIDIFILDGVPNNNFFINLKFFKQKLLNYCNVICITKINTKRKNLFLTYIQYIFLPIFLIIRLIGYKYFVEKLEENAKSYSFEKSTLAAVYAGRGGKKEIMSKNEFLNFKKAKFEKQEFNIPGNFEYYLSKLYGNYMKLPPENKRTSRHDITVFWKGE